MEDDFAREFAMMGQQVEFARNLKANVLNIIPESPVGQVSAPCCYTDIRSISACLAHRPYLTLVSARGLKQMMLATQTAKYVGGK